MKKQSRPLLITIKIFLLILACLFLILLITDPTYTKYGGVLASFILIFLPDILKRTLKIAISPTLELIYLIFLFIALFLGINLDLYKTFPYFDKATHFISGILSVILAILMLRHFKVTPKPTPLSIIFIISFSISIAFLWEAFEFACDKILATQMQELITVGVDDTMLDMLCATLGAILATIYFTHRRDSSKSQLL